MLFGLIKPNDWKIVHKEISLYTIQNAYGNIYTHFNIGESYKKKCTVVLQYSEFRDKYKIKFLDWTPRNSSSNSGYQKCLEKQIELQNK